MIAAARSRNILPGFGLTLGLTVTYLCLIVLIPLAAAFFKASTLGLGGFWHLVTTARAIASYEVTFGASFVASLINLVMGILVAWVLVRYKFPFKKLLDSLVDLPFALPTAVAGISLSTLYGPTGFFGKPLLALGIHAAYSRIGIVIALTFIGMPFIVRTVEPVLADVDKELEEAAASLGANRLQTFVRVLLPTIFPAALTGFALAFARAIGEYGSVIFIAGNMPMKTEITPLLIVTKLEQYDYAGATAIAVAMLIVSFVLLLAINLLQKWAGDRGSRSQIGPARV
jgi:sulfate/thiosulfate transport system permease protein